VNVVRVLHRWWAALLVAAVLVQVAFAGYGAFFVAGKAEDEGDVVTHHQFEDGWDLHTGFGYVVVLIGLVLLVLTLIARPGRRFVWWSLVVAVLLVVQVILAWVGSDVAGIGALHAVNALVIAGSAGAFAGQIWRTRAVATE
jgi:hypothetical protein